MFPVGHIALGYLVAWGVARGMRGGLSLWLVFTVGLLPDLDLLFGGVGLVHETYTHSLVLLVPLSILLFAWQRRSFPYSTALLMHVPGDALLGSFSLLCPLSWARFGLRGPGMGSGFDSFLEAFLLAAMVIVMWRGGDLRRLMEGGRESLVVVPLASMFGLIWLVENGFDTPLVEGVLRLIAFGFSSWALSVISGIHLLLGGIMTAAVL